MRRFAPSPDLNSSSSLNKQQAVIFDYDLINYPLLTAAEEQSLFSWMNFHLFRAEQFRRRASVSNPSGTLTAQVQRELDRATRIRNRIVASNLRLVVSLAKQLSRSFDQMPDLISQGLLPLIRAVELFDISLGYRFSTYATWSVRNEMHRSMKRAQLSTRYFRQTSDYLLESLADQILEPLPDDSALGTAATTVPKMLASLPDRERFVLQARFGLSGEPAGQSLSTIAKRIGLSTEGVRKIVLGALEQLREHFSDPFATE